MKSKQTPATMNMEKASGAWPWPVTQTDQLAVRGFFLANTVAGFLILLIAKIAVLAFTVSGAEGQTPALVTSLKTLLCLGWDVVGAFLFAALLTLLVWPAKRLFRSVWPMTLWSWALYGGYTLFLIISIMTQRGVGTPFDKAAIDLAFLNTDVNPNMAAVTDEDAIWTSIRPYFNVGTFSLMGLMWLTPILGNGLFYRWTMAGSRWKARVTLAFAAAFTLVTLGILPYLRNGEILGIRVHTFGLERSHFVSLVGSYIKPLTREFTKASARIGDPYCFDLGSLLAPGAMEDNPLERARSGGAQPMKTNVIVVVLESVAGVYLNAEPSPMPYLTELAARPGSATLTAHYTTWPQTFKALFSLLCSELPYPDYQPITHVNPGIPCVSLFEAMKHAGYATGHFNSSDLAYDRQLRFYRHRKFDVIHDMYDMPGRDGHWRNNWGIDEAVTIDALFEWVNDLRRIDPDRPFAAMYAMASGHHPYIYPGSPPPPATVTEEEYEAYIGCLGYIDRTIRLLMERLSAAGLDRETLVLIVSDHGEGFLQHPLSKSHGPLVYDEAVRVPAVLVGPQFTTENHSLRFVTSHLDLAPTLLGLLNLPVPATMKGRDLTQPAPVRAAIMSGRPPVSQVGLREGRWKYLLLQEIGREELYDLDADPLERNDLVETQPELAARFKARLLDWQTHSRNLIENYAEIMQTHGRRCDTPGSAP